MAGHGKFRFKSAEELKIKAAELGIELPWSDSLEALFQRAILDGVEVPNRLIVQPMEGFDSDENGTPGEQAFRRYGRYAAGGSGMIWFEATSVVPEGRSNPHQMMITPQTVPTIKKLTDHIRKTAEDTFGPQHRPFLVLQLTHSGRYSKPGGVFQPKIFSRNPVLDDGRPVTDDGREPEALTGNRQPGVRAGLSAGPNKQLLFEDTELDIIKEAYIHALRLAEQAGFDAVDVKACHGYLLHEMLFAYDRTDSRYGGSFEGRTRFLADVLETPTRLIKAVRLSGTDLIPFPHGFGMKPDGSDQIDLTEVKKLISRFSPMVPLWNITAGVPRHAAHIGRPYDRSAFNGPVPEEHPLEGIDRLIRITGELQQAFPDLHLIGSGFSWLRQYYPNVGAGVIAQKKTTFIGLGRSSFAYPDAPKDLMRKNRLDPKKTCISCSKCTEFMRLGVPTGCAVRDGHDPAAYAGAEPVTGKQQVTVHTLIIGSGAAALNAALCLWESGVRDILIVTEQWGGGTSNNAGSDKQTYYKLSLDPSVADSAFDMAADLCRGGAMHGDIALCEAQYSLQAFYNLVRLGVPFPHTDYGAYPGYKTDHDPKARATSAGPLTSHLMFRSLAAKVKEYGIPVHDGVLVVELLTNENDKGKEIVGAIGITIPVGGSPGVEIVVYQAANVILATGGPAGIYRDSVYPVSQTGSTGMALLAGAKAQNISLSQFGIASTKFRWNLSGSYQQVIPRYYSVNEDGSDEKEFLIPHFPDTETLLAAIFLKGYQWPFDPRKVDNFGSSLIDLIVQRETTAGRKVYLDFTRNPSGFSLQKLPPVALAYLEKSGALAESPIERLKLINQPAIDLFASHGIDISKEALEIAVCAQHSNGGLTGDIWWESNIRGLFPIGEVNGSHGITRPGGAALNAGQVGGIRAAEKIVTSYQLPVTSNSEQGLHKQSHVIHQNSQSSGHWSLVTGHYPRMNALLRATGTLHHRTALAELRQRMSDHGGPVRNRETIGEQVKKAWELWKRMNEDLMAVGPSELAEAFRTLDLCLTHAVYLEAIAEYLDKSDNEEFIQQNILEIRLDDHQMVIKKWVPVQPIPREDMWFETVWNAFRTGTNY